MAESGAVPDAYAQEMQAFMHNAAAEPPRPKDAVRAIWRAVADTDSLLRLPDGRDAEVAAA